LSRHFRNQDWPECRFDVVAIDGERLQWLQDAFSG
jgi:Holliday junction resolvase-like predicted endonuclease